MIVHRRFHKVRVARGQLKPVVGLLDKHKSGIRLEGCFAFPLSDTLTFGVFAEVSILHFSGKLLCCDFACLVLVAFSQESMSIWDFLVLGWLTLSDRGFCDHNILGSNTGGYSPALCSTTHDLRWCIAGCDRVSEPYKAVIVTVFPLVRGRMFFAGFVILHGLTLLRVDMLGA